MFEHVTALQFHPSDSPDKVHLIHSFLAPKSLYFLLLSTIQYLGFGLSGSSARTSMFRADATIAWIDSNGMAQAEDYYLSAYIQVRSTLLI